MCLRANGKLIKERRRALGMTQMQLAVALDIGSVAMLSGWERGAQSPTPLALWQTWPQLITYAINGKTSPQGVWARSAGRGFGTSAFRVSASGGVGNYGAQSALRCAPARAI